MQLTTQATTVATMVAYPLMTMKVLVLTQQIPKVVLKMVKIIPKVPLAINPIPKVRLKMAEIMEKEKDEVRKDKDVFDITNIDPTNTMAMVEGEQMDEMVDMLLWKPMKRLPQKD